MEKIFMDLIGTQGIWTALSIVLIFYILKKQERRDIRQEEREIKYQTIIADLTERFSILHNLKEDVQVILDFMIDEKK